MNINARFPCRGGRPSAMEFSAIARLFTKKGLRLSADEVRTVFSMAAQKRAAAAGAGRRRDGMNRCVAKIMRATCD